MKLCDIHLRDPFILPEGGQYYLYGTRCRNECGFSFPGKGLDVYVSEDLQTWSEAKECFTRPEIFWADRDFWAPEVHYRNGAWYMFVSFKSENRCRGTQILRAESPLGPFLPHSDGPVTPPEWECLDGTLLEDEDGRPWLVFCHEWVQIHNGSICCLPLKADLSGPDGNPVQLFCAADAPWVAPVSKKGDYVTDGPFLYRNAAGKLLMLWSSFTADGNYAEAVAVSESGLVTGPWRQSATPLFSFSAGHGMLFHAFDGQLYLVLHTPNTSPDERPHLVALREVGDSFVTD